MPLSTEIDLGLDPGHILLDGDPAPPERGTAAPHFSAHKLLVEAFGFRAIVKCGHTQIRFPVYERRQGSLRP